MSVLSWLVLVGAVCPLRATTTDLIPLHVGGTFPMEAGSGGWAGGEACLPAVQMALDDVNSRPDVLPGYILHVNTTNSKCQPGLASQQLYEFLYTPPTKVMLLAGCSPVTTVIAESAPVWKLIVLSYGASSPALSNRERFPTLFRTHPSANMQNPTRIKLFQKFKWKRVTILQSVEEVFTSTAKDLEEQCRQAGIRAERQSFYGDPTDAIKTLVRQDARIIVGLYYVTEARRVLCQAYIHKLYGRKFVWFLIGWYADTWYIPPPDEHLNCTAEEMAEAAMYHFTTESMMLSLEESPGVSGQTGKEFEQRLSGMLDKDTANVGGFPEAPLAYDAVWALALALNCTRQLLPKGVKLEHFTYEDNVIYPILFDCVKNTSFRGVSGRVMFSDSGDRIAKIKIEQLQKDMKYQIIGYYDTPMRNLTWFNNEQWPSKGPPPDETIVRELMLTVSYQLYYIVALFSFIGLGFCVFFFLFNRRYAGRVVIIQSQPECNNMMILGCVLCLISLFFMGLPTDHISLPRAGFSVLCHSRIALLMFGFTCAYGSMFAKVWIMHRIGATENHQLAARQKDEYKPLLSTYVEKDDTPWEGIRTLISAMVGRPPVGSLRKSSSPVYGTLLVKGNDGHLQQPIPASRFHFVVFIFAALDTLICIAWIVFDPLVRQQKKFPPQEAPFGSEEDVRYEPILELCQSENQEIWISLIFGYKCLVMIFAIFIARETRHLRVRYVNDSKFVHLSIYNATVFCIILGPLATLVVRDKANSNFAFVAGPVLVCTYATLGMIFVPKMKYIHRVPPSADELHANGNGSTRGLSSAEQKRYDQLRAENEQLQAQIEEKERRIQQCKERLDKMMMQNKDEDLLSLSAGNNNTLSVSGDPFVVRNKLDSDENPTYSTPTTLTTTALIEFQPSSETTDRYVEIESEHSSSSSDEILL